MDDITSIGETNFRNQRVRFGIKIDDRRRHIYIIGKTGSGKSNLLEGMAIEDIITGRGVGIIDPHGEFAEKILDFVPEERIDDVVYFNPADLDYPIAFNPLERVGEEHKHLVASGIMSVFKKIWVDAWSARMEYILNNALLALLEYPDSTLLEILRLFSDKEYRKKIVDNLKDPVIKGFWINEFGKYTQRLETESLSAIQNKVGQFVSNPLIRNVIGQPHSTINMRKIMDEEKIFIVNLSKGRIGEDNSALLGAMIITRLQLAAMSRVDIPEESRKDFFLSVDEFQNFATKSFANILSEARKYHLSLSLAHQYVEQLDEDVRAAVFGNVGTLVIFRIGGGDAEFLEKEFSPEFMVNDLVNLPKYNAYIRLMVDGEASRPFSVITIPPMKKPERNFREEIIESSRRKFGVQREKVEEAIAREWLQTGSAPAEEALKRKDERSINVLLREEERRPAAPNKKSFFPKKEVDISDLRHAIEDAILKENEGETKKETEEKNKV
jgi:DNA helicase HerA-like ATPase